MCAERERLARQAEGTLRRSGAGGSQQFEFCRVQAQALPSDRQYSVEAGSRLTSVPHEAQVMKADTHCPWRYPNGLKKTLESYPLTNEYACGACVDEFIVYGTNDCSGMGLRELTPWYVRIAA